MALGTKSFEHRHGVMITLDVYEGTLTVDQAAVWDDGSLGKTHSFAGAVKEGNLLEIYTMSGEDFTVQNRVDQSSTAIVGIAFKNAAPQTGTKTIPDVEDESLLPLDVTWGNYTPRQVTVELLGDWTREVPITSAGDPVTAGQSVQVQQSSALAANLHTWEGALSVTNDTLALSNGALGETAVVMFGRQDVS